MYTYCNNNPVNKVDELGCTPGGALLAGLSFLGPVGLVVAAAIVVTAVVVVACVAVDKTADAVKELVESTENIEKEDRENQSVYILTDPKDENKVKYVGRSSDPDRRKKQHDADPLHPERKDYKMTVVMTGLSVRGAKVAEQLLISAYTISYLDNARREIAVGNLSGYKGDMKAIIQIFESIPEDELRNLMER